MYVCVHFRCSNSEWKKNSKYSPATAKTLPEILDFPLPTLSRSLDIPNWNIIIQKTNKVLFHFISLPIFF